MVEVTAVGDGVLYITSNPGIVGFALLNKAGTPADPYDIANAKAAIDGNDGVTDVCVAGIISQIDQYFDNYNSITYWISEDGTTTDQLQVYSGKDLEGAGFSSKDDVAIGATVVVRGDLKKHNSTYEFDKNNYLVEYTCPGARVGSRTYLLSRHLIGTQFDNNVRNIGKVRHIRIESDGVFLLKALIVQ